MMLLSFFCHCFTVVVDVVVVGGLGRGGGLQHVSDRDKQIPGKI